MIRIIMNGAKTFWNLRRDQRYKIFLMTTFNEDLDINQSAKLRECNNILCGLTNDTDVIELKLSNLFEKAYAERVQRGEAIIRSQESQLWMDFGGLWEIAVDELRDCKVICFVVSK